MKKLCFFRLKKEAYSRKKSATGIKNLLWVARRQKSAQCACGNTESNVQKNLTTLLTVLI